MADDKDKPKQERKATRQEVVAQMLSDTNPFTSDLRLDQVVRGGHIAAMVDNVHALEMHVSYANAICLRLGFYVDAFSKLLVPEEPAAPADSKKKAGAEVVLPRLTPETLMRSFGALDAMLPAINALSLMTGVAERVRSEYEEQKPPSNTGDGLYRSPDVPNKQLISLLHDQVQQIGNDALPAPALSTKNANEPTPEKKRTQARSRGNKRPI